MSTERTHQIDAAASDWLIRRESGAWNAADQAGLDEWLNASTLHRVAFLRLELAWEDAARLKALGAGVPGDRPPPPGHWNLTPFFDPDSSVHLGDGVAAGPPRETDVVPHTIHELPHSGLSAAGTPPVDGSAKLVQPTSLVGEVRTDTTSGRARSLIFRRRRLALAAAFLLFALVVGLYLQLGLNGGRYATPIGGLASVPMADGSNVTLNTDSQIRIALTDTERSVDLKRGEAFFEVSKDAHRPFVVHAGNKRVIAVGTKFSVRRDGDDVEIVVTEGKVRMEDGAAAPSGRPDGSAEVFLTPGSIARADKAGVMVLRRTLPEAEEQLSWRTGRLMFRDQRLSEAIAQFNRYNVRKIVIQNPAIASLKIEGNFRATNAEAFVRLLESGFPVRSEIRDDQIVLEAK
jgi:transmembrane sensor